MMNRARAGQRPPPDPPQPERPPEAPPPERPPETPPPGPDTYPTPGPVELPPENPHVPPPPATAARPWKQGRQDAASFVGGRRQA